MESPEESSEIVKIELPIVLRAATSAMGEMMTPDEVLQKRPGILRRQRYCHNSHVQMNASLHVPPIFEEPVLEGDRHQFVEWRVIRDSPFQLSRSSRSISFAIHTREGLLPGSDSGRCFAHQMHAIAPAVMQPAMLLI